MEVINPPPQQKTDSVPSWVPSNDSSTPSIKDALKSVGRKKNLKIQEFQNGDNLQDYDDYINTVEIPGLSRNDILEAWNLYLDSMNPADTRMLNALRNQEPSIDTENKCLIVSLRNKALVAEFKENFKPSLVTFLSDKLNRMIEVGEKVLEIDDAPQTKYYTDMDKLKFMIEKNPSIAKLKQDFNLDFE